MQQEYKGKVVRKPGLLLSLIPLIVIALFLGIGYGIYQLRAEILLIASALVAGIIAQRLGYTWRVMEAGIVESVTKALPAMLIVICVGMLIGSWIVSGTIPMLVYYGLKIISPTYFLVTTCLVCSIVAVFTGTSWGTVGTMGIAFMGMAQGMGIPAAPTAGAIVAGSYFGDKLSPLSDTTNLAPIAAGSNLFDHIRHTLWTTTPAWLIGMVIYFFVGLKYADNSLGTATMDIVLNTIQANYTFNMLLLLPPVIIIYFAVRNKPTIPGMLTASGLAAVLALIFQDTTLKAVVLAMTNGYVSTSGVEVVDKLLSRGGMMSMMGIALIAFCAFAFAGIIQKAGMLDVILENLLKVATSTGSLVMSVVGSSVVTALITGSSFLAILIPGELFAPAFKKRGLAAKNLSRTTEDSGTVIVPLVPWSMAGVFLAGTLNVPTLKYLPWSVMCYLGVVFALIYGFTGIGIAPKTRDDETIIGS
ncbi:MAG: Na+/H+ antiporter NhaC [Deltaproteobacteria bacterium]|nr:Na+/H+ antiporter NhaC [Deltaproteobacteria bacterium]